MAPGPAHSTAAASRRADLRRALGGIALTVAACACFAVLDATSKHVALAGMPIVMALWLRYVFQAVLTTAYVLHREGLGALRTTQPRFQALRAVLFAATSFFGYQSLRFMPLAEFTAIVATTPLCVTLVAAFWLRQRVSPARWVLVAVGLAGAVLIVRPGGAVFTWALLLPLAMLACGTGYQVISSTMAGRESPATTQLYTGWLATALVSLALPFAWEAVPDPWLWAGTFVMGLASALGHLMLLNAYARTTPPTIAPFLYSQIAFAMLAGWWVYGHVPDGPSLLGMAAIAASGAAGAWLTVREAR
ncbi:DMT family transporter [Paracidovorax anthurii]|uniref:Threonine/homoserine efflux transporter RhtA n=1 Tax=Paracidovorax anthurii TaxID=78229 RepID=A0A328YKN0_9BURK|nr:DMT family transporter [Paracidovorax anthurii]RAR72642.1 threonine/homoserine efflux transporter RhtA [Paracidovorax anthurii]